jgi:hypothetical protein
MVTRRDGEGNQATREWSLTSSTALDQIESKRSRRTAKLKGLENFEGAYVLEIAFPAAGRWVMNRG